MTTNKMQIKAPMTASGKPPQNFPSTKGEFEHLTSTLRAPSTSHTLYDGG